MYTVKLIKGRSYSGAVHVTRKNPEITVEDRQLADDLVATGYFALTNVDEGASDSSEVNAEAIRKMNKEDLMTLAERENIDLSDCKNNEDRAAAIITALCLADS